MEPPCRASGTPESHDSVTFGTPDGKIANSKYILASLAPRNYFTFKFKLEIFSTLLLFSQIPPVGDFSDFINPYDQNS